MKRATIKTLLAITVLFFLTGNASAMEERNAYESADGHWIYFGPAPTDDWTAARPMPQKRSLQQSIRGDALRNYEMPYFELPESGEVISFAPGTSDNRTSARQAAPNPPTSSPWVIYELPESGQSIAFCETDDPAVCG